MRRILSTVILCALVSMSFAQTKAVKEAKKALGSSKFTEARDLIKPALTDPETATDPETWKVAGDIEYSVFDAERDKEVLISTGLGKEKPNFDKMYPTLYSAYAPYIVADSLGQLADEKGKVKNKVRKDIINKLKPAHAYFYNGGAYYSEKKDHSKAADFFEKYWELPSLKVFDDEKVKISTTDSVFQIVKYYAVSSAIQASEHDRAISFLNKINQEPFVANSVYAEDRVYELLASEYLDKKDTLNFLKTLEVGAEKFPKSSYFVPNLINEYLKKKELDKAISYLDQAIINTPSNSCELYSVKASIFAEKLDYEQAFAVYEKALSTDDKCERALEGLALAYVVKAQDIKDNSSKAPSRKEQTDLDNQAAEYYKKAFPLLERYKSSLEARKADNRDVKAALYKLRNVYYNLRMDKEFDAVNAAYEALQ